MTTGRINQVAILACDTHRTRTQRRTRAIVVARRHRPPLTLHVKPRTRGAGVEPEVCLVRNSLHCRVRRTLRPPNRIDASPHASLLTFLDPPAQRTTVYTRRAWHRRKRIHTRLITTTAERARCKTGSSERGERRGRTIKAYHAPFARRFGALYDNLMRTAYEHDSAIHLHPPAATFKAAGGGLQMR